MIVSKNNLNISMKKFWSVLAAATMLVACKEEAPVQGIVSPDVIYGSVEEDGTRTYVDGSGENVRMHWTAGDAVSAFFSSYGEKYVFQGQTGARGGDFAKEGSGFTTGFELQKNYAFYPYAAGLEMDEVGEDKVGTLVYTLPATQNYAEGSFGLGAGLMTAVTAGGTDSHFIFKNVVGFLKLQIYGGGTVKSIVFKGNNSEKLAGKATISIPFEGNPTIEVTGDVTELTLNCGDGIVTAEAKADATSFWFAIPPRVFEGGFTVEVTDGEGKVTTKRVSRSFEIERNMITPMAAFELAGQAPEPPTPEIPDLPDWPWEGSKLPCLFVYTPDNVAITSKENWVTGSHAYLRLPDETVTDLGTANIRWRGNSTLKYNKKAYAFKLDTKAGLLGMPEDKRWDLLANYIDRTHIRNHVALEMGRRLTGLAWTPKGEFVELFINGEHMGNYYLVEHIKISKKRVNIKEMKPEDTDISGGYLMEMGIEYDEPYEFTTNWFTDLYPYNRHFKENGKYHLPVMIKSPEDEAMNNTRLAWIEDYINDVQDKIIANDDEWLEKVDLDSFVDWMLVQEVVGNYEPFHPKSCYMYKDRGGKLFMGPLWDFDYGTFKPNYNTTPVYHYSIWYGYMMNNATFKAKVRERWPAAKAAFEAVAATLPDGESQDWMNLMVSIDRDWAKSRAADPQHQTTDNGDESLGIWVAVKRLKDNLNRRIKQFDETEIPNNFQ